MWQVEATDQFAAWYDDLHADQRERVNAAVDLLAELGPTLKRPIVGTLKGSKHSNLKELRVHEDGHLRVLFMFDPRRAAILLVGGDKTGAWQDWYAHAIPEAERLYDDYLDELRREGLLQ
jgi:hypothetical protein